MLDVKKLINQQLNHTIGECIYYCTQYGETEKDSLMYMYGKNHLLRERSKCKGFFKALKEMSVITFVEYWDYISLINYITSPQNLDYALNCPISEVDCKIRIGIDAEEV